jgi:hypothetical protein
MIRRQPAVDHVDDFDVPFTEPEPARRFLAAVPRVAFDVDDEKGGRFA